MVKQYLCCFNLDTGVTLIGILHLNAALFYFWRWTTFTPVQLWFDLFICLVYIYRTAIFLHGCFTDDMLMTMPSRQRYLDAFWYSAMGLAGIWLVQFIVEWAEWSHLPLGQTIGMLILAALNAYHYIVLKSFKDYDNEEEISQMRHDNDFQPLEQDPETQEARSGIQ